MSDGFDLSAYRASQAEVTHQTFPVRLGMTKDDEGNEREEIVEIPEIRQWPIDTQTKFAEGDVVGAISDLVGPEAAELFRTFRWTLGEFEALFEALSRWSGFQTGRPSVPQPVLGSIPRSS